MRIIVTRKHTDRLSMRVLKRGDLSISVPFDMTDDEIDRFVTDNAEWVRMAKERRESSEKSIADFYSRLPIDNQLQKMQAVIKLRKIVDPYIEKYSVEMGVVPLSVDYKPTKSRWGCCRKRSGRVEFSLYLLLLPEWCIEYVVAHELAHLKVPNHSDEFYRFLGKFYPRWPEARAYLKRCLLQ